MERRLGVSQLGFQEAIIKQMQSFTDQMSLVIKGQQPGPPPPVESGRHSSKLWYVQYGQPGHTRQFCRSGQNRDQRENRGPPPKTNEVKDNLNIGMATIEDLLLEVKVVKTWIRGSSIRIVEDGMHKPNVSPRDKVIIIAIVEETILRTNVVNQIRLLV